MERSRCVKARGALLSLSSGLRDKERGTDNVVKDMFVVTEKSIHNRIPGSFAVGFAVFY